MANQNFEEVVASAVTQASASRKELGCTYAAEFKQNPDVFDPRKLIALGREGFLSFATTVSVPTRVLEPHNEASIEMIASNGAHRDWSNRQRVPLPFELSAFLFGTVAGIGVIFGSALAFVR
jgi:hypothetical protein